MRILAGLLEPSAGRVLFDGSDIVAQPERIWPRLGHLPQSFGFYPNLTGEAMLRHMLRLKGVAAPRSVAELAAELLARVNLTAAAGRKVKTYSGGMRQRLGIAQAIAGDPALVIVDEPTAGLDPEERVRFYRLLAELAETRTVLLSTHLVEDVAMLCPRFAVIRQGRLLATTTPGEARERLAGTMYEGQVERAALAELSAVHCVTQAHLVEGRNRVRLHLPAGRPTPRILPRSSDARGCLPGPDPTRRRRRDLGSPPGRFVNRERLATIAGHEARTQLRSPAFWVLLVILLGITSALNPVAMIPSGETEVGVNGRSPTHRMRWRRASPSAASSPTPFSPR